MLGICEREHWPQKKKKKWTEKFSTKRAHTHRHPLLIECWASARAVLVAHPPLRAYKYSAVHQYSIEILLYYIRMYELNIMHGMEYNKIPSDELNYASKNGYYIKLGTTKLLLLLFHPVLFILAIAVSVLVVCVWETIVDWLRNCDAIRNSLLPDR